MPARQLLRSVLALTLLGGCAGPDPGAYWTAYVDEARMFGLMRTERAPEDAPLSAALITSSFRTLGFSVERDPFSRGQDIREAEMIRKWQSPMAYTILASDADMPRIRSQMTRFAERLNGITGHPIKEAEPPAAAGDDRQDGDDTNLFVLFGEDAVLRALKAYASETAVLRAASSTQQAPGEFTRVEGLSFLGEIVGPWYEAESPCAGQVYIGDGTDNTRRGEVMFAVVMIRSELPTALLEACVEEEVAQVTGLLNDDLDVRPTIFNDDQEFALLTDHDAALLKTLYDPRLKPGMSPSAAMPIVREIARTLVDVN